MLKTLCSCCNSALRRRRTPLPLLLLEVGGGGSIGGVSSGAGGGAAAIAGGNAAAFSADDLGSFSLTEVNVLLGKLSKRKRALQRDMELLDYQLCHEFLTQVKEDKEQQRSVIDKERGLLNADLATLQGSVEVQVKVKSESSTGKRKRTAAASEDGNCSISSGVGSSTPATAAVNAKESSSSMLLSYNQNNSGSSSNVSSIEFDKHDENFATAGVTKEIKIYEYKTIVESNPQLRPTAQCGACRSKISCLSWNPYFKEWSASSDYEGVVSVWNAYTGTRIT
eukprot:gene2872-21225_t